MNRYQLYCKKSTAILLLLLLVNSLALFAQSPSREYQLKAAFLFNFTQFVEWPADSLAAPEAPWVIGVLGENPFGTYLDEIVSGEKINGHPLLIKYYKSAEEIKECHMIFVNFADNKKQAEVISVLKGRSILTVSDEPGFPASGGMVRLFTRDNKIKIEVNIEASNAASLVISSKLLRLAEIFIPNN